MKKVKSDHIVFYMVATLMLFFMLVFYVWYNHTAIFDMLGGQSESLFLSSEAGKKQLEIIIVSTLLFGGILVFSYIVGKDLPSHLRPNKSVHDIVFEDLKLGYQPAEVIQRLREHEYSEKEILMTVRDCLTTFKDSLNSDEKTAWWVITNLRKGATLEELEQKLAYKNLDSSEVKKILRTHEKTYLKLHTK